jgi:phage-related protein
MIGSSILKPLWWIGSSRTDFRKLPAAVQADMGYALYIAQRGGKHRSAKPLKGFGGASVVEVIRNHQGDTFRCVYTIRIAGAIYVLHAFQKKSRTGRETPKAEIKVVAQRLREAENLARGVMR